MKQRPHDVLDEYGTAVLLAAFENPPKPSERLRKLMRQPPCVATSRHDERTLLVLGNGRPDA